MSTIAFLNSQLDTALDALFPRRRVLKKLRSKWGAPGNKESWSSSRYFDLTRHECTTPVVDDKTWADLEFPAILTQLDSTESPLGSQFLFRALRCYRGSASELAETYLSFDALKTNAPLREEIQLRLAELQADSNADIANFIFGETPIASRYLHWVPWWSLACVAALVSVCVLALPIWVWLATLAINMVLIVQLSLPLHRDIEVLKNSDHMMRVADGLASIRGSTPLPPQLLRLVDETSQRAKARKVLGWISVLQGPVIAHLAVWLNLLFVAELVAYSTTVRRVGKIKAGLRSTFEALGSLDAAIAVASYLSSRPAHCQPVMANDDLLEITDGNHPLIKCPVTNSIRLAGHSALITGSNMAGKTTFIKMLGINIILGRTLGFCLASGAILPNSSVMASIRGEHSVESGKSHYSAELEAIHSFIEKADRGDCKLFLIDELFNGTNTVERLAAARAVLESISNNAQALVTTHDVELQDDLEGIYDLYYFEENPDVERYFDFQLRSGKSTKRNAIALLARKGLPTDIVANAMRYSEFYANRSAG